MIQVNSYKCEYSGKLFEDKNECKIHEQKHYLMEQANKKFLSGDTLGTIDDSLNIWGEKLPRYLRNATVNSYFIISYLPELLKITEITLDKKIKLFANSRTGGYYNSDFEVDSELLNNLIIN